METGGLTMKIVKIVMMAAVLAAAGISAHAQQGQRPVPAPTGGQHEEDRDVSGPPDRGGPPSEQQMGEVRKKMEAVRMWRLTEALKLDEKTSAKLAAVLGSLDQQRAAIMRDNMVTIRELRSTLKAGNPDEKKLKAALEKIRKNQDAMMDLRKKETHEIKDILTLEQQARYLIFQHEFGREMRGMISGARGQKSGGKGKRGSLGSPAGPTGGGTEAGAPPSSPPGER
jgi:Spy/CpxP family protein refolding chaperone